MQLIGLNTELLGKNCIHYEEIDSTQNRIWKLYEENAPSGTLVIADKQTAGIGTHGRVWYTDEENNVAMSILIKTECEVSQTEGLTIEIAKVIVKIMKEKYNISLSIKEPNDIVCHGKKIAGILTQSKVVKNIVKCLVIGIGINTMQQVFADEIKNSASSIKNEFDVEIDSKEFIVEFCNEFEKELKNRKII